MSEDVISFLVDVHTLPDDLRAALNNRADPLYTSAQIYQKLVHTELLWKIWHIDKYGAYWIEVNFINNDGQAEFHTIKIDQGSFTRVDYDDYAVLTD